MKIRIKGMCEDLQGENLQNSYYHENKTSIKYLKFCHTNVEVFVIIVLFLGIGKINVLC
jgi:hypothetical protein